MRRSISQTTDLEAIILKQVRAVGRISRVELARALELAPSTAGVYVDRLLAERFLIEIEETASGTGRPPRTLTPNPEGGEFIGVDFEARNIMAVAVDFSDRPLRTVRKAIDPSDSAEDVIRKIESAIRSVLPTAKSRLLAIGVGVPGIVDPAQGVALTYKFIRGWQNVPLASRLSKQFSVPVFLENNARSMALAELWFGLGKGQRDFLCLGLRNGVGAGMVINGRLHSGAYNAAGEVGRWPCRLSSNAAGALFGQTEGEEIELQEVTSARAVLSALQRAASQGKKTVLARAKEALTMADIMSACQQGDPLALAVTEEAANALGRAIGELALAFDPSKVILAGPLTALGDAFLLPVRSVVTKLMVHSDRHAPEVVNSTMGEFGGALGAAALALHQWKPVSSASRAEVKTQPATKRKARSR